MSSGMLKVLLFLWNRTTSFVLSLFALRTLIGPIFVDLPVKGIRSVIARIRSLKWPKSFTSRELLTFLRKCFVIIVAPLHSFRNVQDFAIAILYIFATSTLVLVCGTQEFAKYWQNSISCICVASLVVQFIQQNLQTSITTGERNKFGLIIRGILHGGLFVSISFPGILLMYGVGQAFDDGLTILEEVVIDIHSDTDAAIAAAIDSQQTRQGNYGFPTKWLMEPISTAYETGLKQVNLTLKDFPLLVRFVFSVAYMLLKIAGLIAFFVVVAVLSKAVITLFFRSLLRDGVKMRFTLVAKETAKRKMARVITDGPTMKIDLGEKLHTRCNWSGKIESSRTTKKTRAPLLSRGCRIARLRNSLLITKSYWRREQNDCSVTVEMSASKGDRLVQVCLGAGEQICVSLNHLIAFNDTIRFESLVDLKVTSWFVGRSVQYLANGPGTLVFLVAGKPTIWRTSSESQDMRIEDTERLVCWPADLEFSTDEIHTVTDMYFGTPSVFVHKDHGSGPIILDYNVGGKRSNEFWRALTRLYRPW
jgi:uncharacterized protein (AIM24 family)